MANIYGTSGDNNPLDGTSGNDKIYGYGGADSLSGGDGNDSLYAGAGNDRLYGDAGNDFLDGGAGADFLYGGIGNDTYVVDDAGDIVTELFDEGVDEVRTSVSYTMAENIENLRVVGDVGLLVLGNDLNNSMVGGAGRDFMEGEGGNDSMNGGAGGDTINGGAGNDILYGGDGNDMLSGGSGLDALYGGAGNDMFTDVTVAELIKLTGGAGYDFVVLEGFGTESFKLDMALKGIERINGNSGANIFDASGVTEQNGGTGIYADVQAYGGDDILIGSAFKDILNGGTENDQVYGGGGDDILFGSLGDDLLVGGAGSDTLYDDTGADIFRFAAGDSLAADASQGDKISGFAQGEDRIDLSAIAGLSFAGLEITSASGHTYIGFDTDGVGGIDSYIDVTGTVAFTAADFIFGP